MADTEALKPSYAELTDDELRYIATHSTLTAVAQAELDSELGRRGIADLDEYRRQLAEEHKPDRLALLTERFRQGLRIGHDGWMVLLLGGIYVAPADPDSGAADGRKRPLALSVATLYCVVVSAVHLFGMARLFAQAQLVLPVPYKLFTYLGPTLLLISGGLLFKLSRLAIPLLVAHVVWLLIASPVTGIVLERYLGTSATSFVNLRYVLELIVPSALCAYSWFLWKRGVLK